MNNRTRYAGATLVAVLVVISGCNSPPPWQTDWGRSSSLSSFFGRKPASPTYPAMPGAAPATNPVTSATQSINKAVQTAGDKVAAAFDVKPKVIPANDPAKLSSQPARLTPALYVQAALLSENQRAITQAKRQYEKALELDPRDVSTLVAMARFYDRQSQPDEALRRYQQARGIAPANTVVLNDLGLFHARHGNADAAFEALDQAVRLDPRNVRYRNNLAATLIESNRVAEAIDVLRGVHPEATALFNAACLLAMTNQPQPAASLLEQSLRLDPTLTAARDMLRDLRSDSLLAQPALPPRGIQTMPLNASLPPAYETACRTGPTVWESTSVYARPYGPDEPADWPRKLPAAD